MLGQAQEERQVRWDRMIKEMGQRVALELIYQEGMQASDDEGYDLGFEEGSANADSRESDAYDEGYAAGREDEAADRQ
jgi:hypothetical protein